MHVQEDRKLQQAFATFSAAESLIGACRIAVRLACAQQCKKAMQLPETWHAGSCQGV